MRSSVTIFYSNSHFITNYYFSGKNICKKFCTVAPARLSQELLNLSGNQVESGSTRNDILLKPAAAHFEISKFSKVKISLQLFTGFVFSKGTLNLGKFRNSCLLSK